MREAVVCQTCSLDKTESDFNSRRPWNRCKGCKSAMRRARYLANGKAELERQKAYCKRKYYADVEKSRAYFRQQRRNWTAKNPGRAYWKNVEKNRAYQATWRREFRKKNPALARARDRRYIDGKNAKRRGATAVECVDYEAIFVRDKGRCHLCKRKVKRADAHFDHVIPLSKGGLHTATNVATTHPICNMQKFTKVLTLF